MTKSIMLVGVGGQGTILASKLLTTGLMNAGYDVKMSEIHGMVLYLRKLDMVKKFIHQLLKLVVQIY